MNRIKSIYFIKTAAFCFILVLCLAGCPEPEGDYSISEITIFNIPETIEVDGKPGVSAPTYKVYLNASNTQSDTDPPVAKGLALLRPAMKQADGTYTIIMQLQKPNPEDKPDPNHSTGNWSGTAVYFSLMISPQHRTADGVNAVWVKGGITLDKGRKRINWKEGLMDFRDTSLADMKLDEKAASLYRDIIRKDPLLIDIGGPWFIDN